MDPMEQNEEEMRRKEEEHQRDLEETIGLGDFFSSKDLSTRGKNVRPSGKQIKDIQTIASNLRIRDSSRRRSTGEVSYDFTKPSDFDILGTPRIFITEGAINKREPDPTGILWKISRKHLFLFNDVLLVTQPNSSQSEYDLQQVLWIKDMKINNLAYDEDEDPTAFEILMYSGNKRPHMSLIFTCDSEPNKEHWFTEISYSIFGYYRNSPLSRKLGWFYEVCLGSIHSAAYTGNSLMLRKHLRLLEKNKVKFNPDAPDECGMAAIHWAALKGNEACLRILVDKGADVDCLNGGLNSPLLLAAAYGHDTVARILIEKGSDPMIRNLRDRDAVFMAVVYGHASKGLPWTLQLLNSKGVNLNQVDSLGATPLHVCAEKNLARPVRMLVDAGANVNVKHQKTGLTPLQMACSHDIPDVETIRSFLDKGAYANWRDFQGRTAFEMVLNIHNRRSTGVIQNTPSNSSTSPSPNIVGNSKTSGLEDGLDKKASEPKWRDMEATIEKVGDWAVRALPVILEIVKKGGRYDPKSLEGLRTSFKSAVELAKIEWDEKKETPNFTDFVLAREQAGEDLQLHKSLWIRNEASSSCQLCTAEYSLKNRRHHCRACGSLACDFCSTKRLRLTVIDDSKDSSGQNEPEDSRQRVCDGCFNRLIHEASQPSLDHPRVRELKLCALELMESIGELIESLDDPRGESGKSNYEESSPRKSINGSDRNSLMTPPRMNSRPQLQQSSSASRLNQLTPPSTELNGGRGLERIAVAKAGEELIEAIKRREEKLTRAENLTMKFLEASDGYHRIAKKLIQQKNASNRLWGLNI
mmetsp:Transcript_24130/g.24718  ORF Transcript_24130/g.24718 Transcript_24130/m.24718 type:complete len:810 (+) Transcript_24130:123-2552(+)|eukprot:CAMPEP_0174822964 /NCGR_PEP_ID=MMETSP1107-20130205/20227_1 /TAXON_ID=36770 /ORGANISM="Paraphysomonas vestita, Strain GFlagA" /LENGTH=809 /DNA_ID=CAMNT_0016043637 /DNA_START=8 /DNA_END=2437 /DNA_ORIENTATION=-